ncbi:MAG TPA: hypothetical protein VGL02_14825 [Streptomyces sp.]
MIGSQLLDLDPAETQEWLASPDGAVDHEGAGRARYPVLSWPQRARDRHLGMPGLGNTDYTTTIPPDLEPLFPGEERIERRIRADIRWNAAIMVHRAQRPGIGVGGHLSTYASAASLYEVGRLKDEQRPVVAVSDWMRAGPDQIAPFVPGDWCSVGTNGFGLSDTRPAPRHFRIDAESIVHRVLHQLVRCGEPGGLARAAETYRLDSVNR